MTRSTLVLLGGVAAVVAGVFSFCVDVLYDLLLASVEVIPFSVPPLLTLAGIITTSLYAVALVGLYALPGRRSAPGIAGLVLAFLAFVAASSPWIVYALYQVIFLGRTTVRSSVLFFPQTAVDLAGDALLAGAVLLLAVGAWRTRVLGRWVFLLFVIAFLYVLPLLFYAGYSLGFGSFPWLAFLPSWLRGPFWVLLGAALCRRAPQMRTAPDPAAPSGGRTDEAGG